MSASRPGKPELLVVGVGNEMMRDEGVGMAVARELQGRELGARVRVLELGTRGFDLICEMEGVARVIVIDAVRAGGEPGSIYQFAPEQARSTNDAGGTEVPPLRRTSSLHGLDLLDVIELAAVTGIRPEVTIVGVEPEEVAPGQGLSPTVGRRVGELVEMVERLVEDNAA